MICLYPSLCKLWVHQCHPSKTDYLMASAANTLTAHRAYPYKSNFNPSRDCVYILKTDTINLDRPPGLQITNSTWKQFQPFQGAIFKLKTVTQWQNKGKQKPIWQYLDQIWIFNSNFSPSGISKNHKIYFQTHVVYIVGSNFNR